MQGIEVTQTNPLLPASFMKMEYFTILTDKSYKPKKKKKKVNKTVQHCVNN